MSTRLPPFFEENSTPVSERIGQALSKIGLALKHQSWTQANAQGLSPTQGQILATLAEGPLSGSELSARLGLSLPTISDSVKALVEKGLVTKSPDPRHPRASLVSLTSPGGAAARKSKAWPEFLADAVGTLSPPEQEVFNAGLLKMIRMLQEEGHISAHRMCITCTHFRPRVHPGALPHHCALVDAPLADRHLRGDCPEQEEAPEPLRTQNWQRFSQTP
ncbi:winged helix-turn-helix transcriptional regulator [Myxococcaceae bacterium JPH2]|nr:winged helix-turn-helix transcriptional regulator [Myxococcaceae bacterium JPH2]